MFALGVSPWEKYEVRTPFALSALGVVREKKFITYLCELNLYSKGDREAFSSIACCKSDRF